MSGLTAVGRSAICWFQRSGRLRIVREVSPSGLRTPRCLIHRTAALGRSCIAVTG
jgi:hypothetical protein